MRDTTRLERRTIALDGHHAQLRLENGHITIRTQRSGQTRPVTVTVALEQVRGATVDRPSRGQPGWFHLAVVGGSVRPASALAASVDPYAMPLSGREIGVARRLVRLIADHVRKRGLPPESADDQLSPAVTVTASSSRPSPEPSRPSSAPPSAGAQSPSDPPPVDAGASDGDGDANAELHLCELADLHRAGVLTDTEYARARSRVAAAARHDSP